jgi:tetraacyldisaccharide 4'-kinase
MIFIKIACHDLFMKELIANKIFKIQYKKRSGLKLSIAELTVWPLLVIGGFIYYSLNYLKWFLFKHGILKSYKPDIFCVSVGNVKIGGTGKSPLCIKIAAAIVNSGGEAAIINRGYLGAVKGLNIISDGVRLLKKIEECSDEAYMEALALIGGKDESERVRNNGGFMDSCERFVTFGENKVIVDKGAAVLTSKRRVESVVHLQSNGFNGICILDDAFQYYRLVKNLNIVVLDYSDPFSNGLTFPAGALRDRISRLGEADIIVISKCPSAAPEDDLKTASIKSVCRRRGFIGNFYKSAVVIKGLYSLKARAASPFSVLKGGRAFVTAGIADNKNFFASIAEEARLNGFDFFCEGFIDHSDYNYSMQRDILNKMKGPGASALITTFKDAVKLQRDIFKDVAVYAVLFDVIIESEESFIAEIINKYKNGSGRV